MKQSSNYWWHYQHQVQLIYGCHVTSFISEVSSSVSSRPEEDPFGSKRYLSILDKATVLYCKLSMVSRTSSFSAFIRKSHFFWKWTMLFLTVSYLNFEDPWWLCIQVYLLSMCWYINLEVNPPYRKSILYFVHWFIIYKIFIHPMCYLVRLARIKDVCAFTKTFWTVINQYLPFFAFIFIIGKCLRTLHLDSPPSL